MTIDGIIGSIVTVLAGLIALMVYQLHKRDEMQKAAKIILMEIREAEKCITELKNNGTVNDFSSILPFNSWTKYNHLFVQRLDRDELDLINNFYRSCFVAEKEIQRLNNFLPIAMEEKSKKLQSMLIEIADKHKDDEKIYNQQKEALLRLIHEEEYWFLPNAPKQKLISYLQNIEYITTSSVGEKLKDIAIIR